MKLLLFTILLVTMLLSVHANDKVVMLSSCKSLPATGVSFTREKCINFTDLITDKNLMYLPDNGPCPKVKCATTVVACVAACVYDFPLCSGYKQVEMGTRCTDCLEALYSDCCSCVLPASFCK